MKTYKYRTEQARGCAPLGFLFCRQKKYETTSTTTRRTGTTTDIGMTAPLFVDETNVLLHITP
jgi:hypothetical protein